MMLTSNPTTMLQNWPVTGAVVLFPLSLLFIKKFLKDNLGFIVLFTFYSVIMWFLIAFLTRYAHFIPLSIIITAITIHYLTLKIPVNFNKKWYKVVLIIFSTFVMIGPTPSALYYYTYNFNKKVPVTEEEIAYYVDRNEDNTFKIIKLLKTCEIPEGNIYAYGYHRHKFYYLENGYHIKSNDTGEYSFSRFNKAVNDGVLVDYVSKYKINGILIRKQYLKDPDIIKKIMKYREFKLVYDDELTAIFNVLPLP